MSGDNHNQADPALRNTLSIHVDISDEATPVEARDFFDALARWVGKWMDKHPDRGAWDPFVYAHTEACEHSDHCYGPGSHAERRIIDAIEDNPSVFEELGAMQTGVIDESWTRTDAEIAEMVRDICEIRGEVSS